MKGDYSDRGPCFPPSVDGNVLDEGHTSPVVVVADRVIRLSTIQ